MSLRAPAMLREYSIGKLNWCRATSNSLQHRVQYQGLTGFWRLIFLVTQWYFSVNIWFFLFLSARKSFYFFQLLRFKFFIHLSGYIFFFVVSFDPREVGFGFRAATNDYFSLSIKLLIIFWWKMVKKYLSVFPKAQDDVLKCLCSLHNSKIFSEETSKYSHLRSWKSENFGLKKKKKKLLKTDLSIIKIVGESFNSLTTNLLIL